MGLANPQYIVVTAHPSASSGAVMLYWAPDIASAVQRYCYDGESFTVLAYNNEWLQVRDEKSGFTGYMLREFAY